MKTRQEYEKQLNRTFVQAGNESLERMRMDVLLDIRELLIWLQGDIMFQRLVKERMAVTTLRRETIDNMPM